MAWLTAAGTLVSAYSSYKAGQDQKDYYDKAGRASESDAAAQRRASERAAALLRERGGRAISREIREGRELTAAQRASYSKAGVKLIGTPTEVISQTVRDVNRTVRETAYDIEMDALTILESGTAEASRSLSLADMFEDRGTYAERAGYMGSFATLLTGYSRYKQQDREYRLEG